MFMHHLGRSTLSLLSLLLYAAATETPLPPYTPTDLIRLDCGASSDATSLDGRNWVADAHSKFLASNPPTASSSLTASIQDPSVTLVPYMTARVIYSRFTYSFPVLPGPKFIRLHFYPASYSNLDTTNSFFSLVANNYALLNNFSASLTASAATPPVASFFREFIVTVWDNQNLRITFSPSPGSFAFVNGIEIVSMPTNLYAYGNNRPINYVGLDYLFYLDHATALENVYRINVGGQDIDGIDDTGMYRTWNRDSDFLLNNQAGITPIPDYRIRLKYTKETPPYTAPVSVYATFRAMSPLQRFNLNSNLTWFFPVDAGFNYLVRLHFCESRIEVKKVNDVVFCIFINNQTAELDADVINWSGGVDVPVYKDYVVWVPEESHDRQDLFLALQPSISVKSRFHEVILNGIEIFKLNKSDGSLAGPNPAPLKAPTPQPGEHPNMKDMTKRRESSQVMVIVGPVFGSTFALFLVLCFLIFKRKRGAKKSRKSEHDSHSVPWSRNSRSTVTNASLLPSNVCRQFSLFEIEMATCKFDDEFLIGSGGFGNVYKGHIDDGAVPVAIKRLHSSSRQGVREFRTEIQLLSKLRHAHLVALIGYCEDPGEMVLVYEYMHRGTLRDHLYNTKNPPLPWKRRLEICIGAARGLHHLHKGMKYMIIHRDVKSTNILIDENWVAKVSDFGLSRVGPIRHSQTHVSTIVRGSLGYVDPEYYRRQQLTEKSDVYSFGVVLFEVLCARPPAIPCLPKEQVSLVEWARHCYQEGNFDGIIDPNLRGGIAPLSLQKFGEIADSCVRDQGRQRPAMSDVVCGLEFAMQLQDAAEGNVEVANGVSVGQESPLLPHGKVITTDGDDTFSGAGGHESTPRSTASSSGRSFCRRDPRRLMSRSMSS